MPRTITGKVKTQAHSIPDEDTQHRDLYFGELVERFLNEVDRRRQYAIGRYSKAHRISWSNISRLSGVPRETVVNHMARRNRGMTIQQLDKYLFAMKMSILDLLEPREIVSLLRSLDYHERIGVSRSMKRTLDKLREVADNHSSAGDSQSSTQAEASN